MLDARSRAEATIREIPGQGPEKTLGRGFAVVCQSRGEAVEQALEEALKGSGVERQAESARAQATEPPVKPADDDNDDIPF